MKNAIEKGEEGSSPLARGLRGAEVGARWESLDHPRSRGVYKCVIMGEKSFIGSSPLARGLRRARAPDKVRPGIIPARAGFTPHRRQNYPTWSDHPRSRGVYVTVNEAILRRAGSSPLARGLQVADFILIGQNRIIPARAGFTSLFGR